MFLKHYKVTYSVHLCVNIHKFAGIILEMGNIKVEDDQSQSIQSQFPVFHLSWGIFPIYYKIICEK